MVGTAENPVRLWPYSRIVEVGWPGIYTAFAIAIGNEISTPTSEPCSPVEGIPADDRHNDYLPETSMELTIGGSMRYRESTGEWSVISNATFSGQPTTPFYHNHGPGVVSSLYHVYGPHRFTLDGGSAIPDIPVPGQTPVVNFLNSVALGYDVIGLPLDPGSGACEAEFGFGAFIYYTQAGEPGAVVSGLIGLASIVMTVGGREYTPIGVYLIPETKGGNPSVEIDAPDHGWVLCRRSDVTA